MPSYFPFSSHNPALYCQLCLQKIALRGTPQTHQFPPVSSWMSEWVKGFQASHGLGRLGKFRKKKIKRWHICLLHHHHHWPEGGHLLPAPSTPSLHLPALSWALRCPPSHRPLELGSVSVIVCSSLFILQVIADMEETSYDCIIKYRCQAKIHSFRRSIFCYLHLQGCASSPSPTPDHPA